MLPQSFRVVGGLLTVWLAVFSFAAAQDPSSYSTQPAPAVGPEDAKRTASLEEIRQGLARNKVLRQVKQQFMRANLPKSERAARPSSEDYFVVAKFQMPLRTRDAELRFELAQGIDAGSEQAVDYLLDRPSETIRDLRVLGRFKSPESATEGIAAVRKEYDAYKAYQAKMLAELKQYQARSMRRC